MLSQTNTNQGEAPLKGSNLLLMKDLTAEERFLFMSEFDQVKKTSGTGIVLCLFLGGFGGHRFYMGEMGIGILYILFCWTLIPGIIALVELFLISGRVREYNSTAAHRILCTIKALEPQSVDRRAEAC